MSKPKILEDELLEKLIKLPNLVYGEDLDTISPTRLRILMEALDDTADYINDYLTENSLGYVHQYPDIPVNTKQ